MFPRKVVVIVYGNSHSTIYKEMVAAICGGYCSDPFSVLGMHVIGSDPSSGNYHSITCVRAFYPFAENISVRALDTDELVPMQKIHPDGFFEALFYNRSQPFSYRLVITEDDGAVHETFDPYSFPLLLSDFDLHLISEGNHFQLWQVLGAHLTEINGVWGVLFAVWAPNAFRVSVVGDFNRWDGRVHPMRLRHKAGIWELFIPNLDVNTLYKFEVKSRYHGFMEVKSDPFGFLYEVRPKTSSIVWDLRGYKWHDEGWMSYRGEVNRLDKPIAIYEVHLGSYKRILKDGNTWLNYRELSEQLVSYVKDMGFTHIELLPIMEHPLDESWGYQVTGYYAPTSRYGTPDDFKAFIDACHQNGIGVILDWVPAHFPKDMHGLVYFDGTNLYEYDGWKGDHPDWHTKVFNYGRTEVKNFLIANALFWLKEYHVDGLRADGVASMLYLDYSRKEGEWEPNIYGGRENLEAIEFLKRLNEVVHKEVPQALVIAEESTAWPMVTRPTYIGGLGFDLKWNMGWMHDSLYYFGKDPIYRRYHQNDLTFSAWYAFSENFILPLSHDEVVHGKQSLLTKMPGDLWQKFANLRALFGYMYAHPGKKLLFMGNEIGQWREWSYSSSLDWDLLQWESHKGIQSLVRDLNLTYKNEPALHQWDCDNRGFEWIDFHDADHSIISFIRWSENWKDCIVIVCNFTPVVRHDYRVGVPYGGIWTEIFNTDRKQYGGTNLTNGKIASEELPWQHRPYSIRLTLPPLSVMFFKAKA